VSEFGINSFASIRSPGAIAVVRIHPMLISDLDGKRFDG
jgi:hypothetical protein